jgi:hypothetical protein
MFSCTNSRLNPDGTNIIDNELLTDPCIAMEDGSPSWLSPDIILTSSLGVADEARKGENNTVAVRVRKSCNLADTVLVELWVANPSLNFAPNVNSIKIFDAPVTSSFELDKAIDSVRLVAQVSRTWTADEALSNNVPTDVDPLRLHRCLVARSYPSNLTPPDAKFCVTEDPHVAQRNIAIVKVPGQRVRRLSFPIETTVGNREFAEAAMVRVIADRIPSVAILKAILPSLEQFSGFRQIAQIAPKGFALQISENFSPVLRDKSRLEKIDPINPKDVPFRDIWQYVFRREGSFGRFRNVVFDNPTIVLQEAIADRKFNSSLNARNLKTPTNLRVAPNLNISPGLEKLVEQAAPSFEADIKLPPNEVANFTFTADLPESSQPGDAHIFHVMHINDQQQVIGGLTIVAVVDEASNIKAADQLTNQRGELVRNGYLAIFDNQPPPHTNSRQIAACLRDLDYYIGLIIDSCRQDNGVQALDVFFANIKETNNALGYPNSWFITFYQFIKDNHGLTDDVANLANSYLDHAISALS